MTQTIRQVTLTLLRKLELTTIFGNPGSTEETFLKDFPKDFRYIQVLQEASAVGAADAYAQATRKPALVNVHTSAGVCNAMSNILSASMNKTPLIITAGNQTREMLLMEPWLTNVQPAELPKPWVKWSYEPVRAEDVPAAIMQAYAMALQPPAGPVFLSIPLDDWDKPAKNDAAVRNVTRRIGPDPARISEFAAILSQARNPALIYGAAIARGEGWQQAIDLAEKLNAPVWAAPATERPPFPENHPLYAGALPFATAPLAKKLEGHDVAIVIGAPVFRYYPYVPGPYIPEGLRLLHISDDPAETGRAPVGDSMLSDPVLALEALAAHIQPRTNQRPAAAPSSRTQQGTAHTLQGTAPRNQDGPLTPYELYTALREAAPAETVLVAETPSNLGALRKAWPIVTPDSFYTFASGSLGWGLPASVGIALAERDSHRNRPVMAVIGDGSMQYSIQGLWTAAQQGLSVLFVIPRNEQYAILKSFASQEKTSGVPGLDLPGLDIVSLARGYGCEAVRAETAEDVCKACAQALTRPGPTVLEVPISHAIPPLL